MARKSRPLKEIARPKALVPAAGAQFLLGAPDAGPSVAQDGDTTLVSGVTLLTHGQRIHEAEAFFVDSVAPKGDGPWRGEADKVAWRDPATGYECIVMRAYPGGFLGGYVGVPSSHPLYGFEAGAIPAELGITAHGGVTYSAMCEDGPSPARRPRHEARSICHVPTSYHPVTHAGEHRVEDAHAWWFGFQCDGLDDLVPNDRGHAGRAAAQGVVQHYRDDAFVVEMVRHLAARLRAVADEASALDDRAPALQAPGRDPA